MTEDTLKRALRITAEIKERKFQIETLKTLSSELFGHANAKRQYPELNPQARVKVTVEYSDEHDNHTMTLDLSQSWAMLEVCKEELEHSLKKLESMFAEM